MLKGSNADHNGLGEMATFLSVFSKKVTACPIPLAGFGYVLLYSTKFP